MSNKVELKETVTIDSGSVIRIGAMKEFITGLNEIYKERSDALYEGLEIDLDDLSAFSDEDARIIQFATEATKLRLYIHQEAMVTAISSVLAAVYSQLVKTDS
jgi:hypothetical protein